MVLAVFALVAPRPQAAPAIEILSPTGGLPPNIVGQLREPAAFVETDDGRFLVFDRRAQAIYSVDAKKTLLKKLIPIGPSDGEILQPSAFALSANKTFSVVDTPGKYERVQTFYDDGTSLSRFRRWPTPGDAPRLSSDGVLSTGLGAIAALGRDLITHIPDGEALISVINPEGQITRRIGLLRATGKERDTPLHRALNVGIPLVAPDGSFYFVFTSGIPMLRKYSPAGDFLFERHIEGPELDAVLQTLPTVWPIRTIGDKEFPNVAATVRAASVDPQGQVWISLAVPFTYVYDDGGNKTRTIQFRGAGIISPASLFFAKGGRLLVTPGCYEYRATQ